MQTTERDLWAGLGTSTISDALDKLAIVGQVDGLWPVDPEMGLIGNAYTLAYHPMDGSGGTVGDYIDDVPAGSVIVIDNRGRQDVTVWGDILTSVAHTRSIAGCVIDGVCRDSALSVELAYPIFSRGRWMRTGKDRVKLVATQTPVVIGSVRVSPDDLIIGDRDGVVVVPASSADAVLATALAIDAAEDEIRRDTRNGAGLAEARARHSYHALQTPTAHPDKSSPALPA